MLQYPIKPMLAVLTKSVPEEAGFIFEPKWDGFRCLVFWDGADLYLQSRDLKPLARYFPELVEGLKASLPKPCVIDGEIVIASPREGLDFEALLQRIHPAESRIRKLAQETPASFVAFDLLAVDGEDLQAAPFGERRTKLVELVKQRRPPLFLTPATEDPEVARVWFERFEGAGLDGVMAKRSTQGYLPDQRAMLKIKHSRTADVVVGGFRWAKEKEGEAVGSLLLGLYSQDGVLQHVGFSSSFKAAERKELVKLLAPYREETPSHDGFGDGRTPGAPSRWTGDKDLSWQALRPELVCEVSFDHMQGERFRHGAKFQRWRPDKPPRDCTYEQLRVAVPYELAEIFKSSSCD